MDAYTCSVCVIGEEFDKSQVPLEEVANILTSSRQARTPLLGVSAVVSLSYVCLVSL